MQKALGERSDTLGRHKKPAEWNATVLAQRDISQSARAAVDTMQLPDNSPRHELPLVPQLAEMDWSMMQPTRDTPTERGWNVMEVDDVLQFLKDTHLDDTHSVRLSETEAITTPLGLRVRFDIERQGAKSVSSEWRFNHVCDAGYLGYAWR